MRQLTATIPALLAIACLQAPSTVVAQSAAAPRYHFPSDTLRYWESTSSRVSMTVPTGEIVVENSHDAIIGLRGRDGSRVHAWYERLDLREKGPQPSRGPLDASGLLRKPFALVISPRGLVRTDSAPPMPAPIAASTDLTRQFDDFFVGLPGSALKPGTQWTDTLVFARSDRPDSASSTRHVRSYRVERDTVVSGAPAVVIAVSQRVLMESVAPMPGQPMQMRTRLEGEETGRAVFLTTVGQLYLRERKGSMSGQLTISGAPQPVSIPQRFEYTSSITRLGNPK